MNQPVSRIFSSGATLRLLLKSMIKLFQYLQPVLVSLVTARCPKIGVFSIPVTCLSWEVLLRLRSHFSWRWAHWRQKSGNHLFHTFCLCLQMISGGATLDFTDQKSTLQPLTRWPEKGLYSTISMFNRSVHQPEEHLWLEGIPFTQV